jgi:hypothetical protein
MHVAQISPPPSVLQVADCPTDFVSVTEYPPEMNPEYGDPAEAPIPMLQPWELLLISMLVIPQVVPVDWQLMSS